MSHSEYLPAPELLSTVSQPGLEIFQVTTDPETASNVFYNYREALDPSSRYILINRSGKEGSRLVLCDLQDDFALTPVTEPAEWSIGGHASMSFSPDGHSIWYTLPVGERWELRRQAISGGPAETVFSLDRNRTEFAGRRITGSRWLSFSHDGKRLLAVVTLEGSGKFNSVAILTFDLTRMTPHSAFETGPRNWNNKSQYAPCPGPNGEYLICVGDFYSQTWIDGDGKWNCEKTPDAEPGGTDYLVDEEGTVRFAYPVGRDRPHQNISHWAWFGRSLAKVFHCDAFDTAPHWRGAMMLAEPVAADDSTRHLGRHLPGGRQIELTRHIKRPDVCHICVTPDASCMVCDTIGYHEGPQSYLYTATLDADGDGPLLQPRYLLHPQSSWKPYWCECIPCMTPNKRWILFNSDYPGVNGYKGNRHTPQVFAARGFEL